MVKIIMDKLRQNMNKNSNNPPKKENKEKQEFFKREYKTQETNHRPTYKHTNNWSIISDLSTLLKRQR